jgi:trans-2,3-dihydro-3-hydroxyanthranilate isomerase
MRRLPFVQLDVFTDTPLQGNQLAVFTDARGLTDVEMRRIAKETNLSETTFIFPDDGGTPDSGTKVRIFTVEEELPFAGHPTLGTAVALRGQTDTPKVVLDLKVGKIPVTFTQADSDLPFCEMRQRDPEFGETHSAVDIAKICGLSAGDLRTDIPIQTVSTGNAFILVPVKSLAAMQRLIFNYAEAKRYLEQHSGKFFYWISSECSSPEAQFHARMIFYNGEDPATGSAAGPAIAWLVKHGLVKSDERVMIEQGVEMNRRSHLFVRAKREGDRVTDVHVGGYAIEIARGEYLLP